jgi:hypothetical protein
VRVIDAFVDALDLRALGFDGVSPKQPDARPTILRFCSNCTSTAISIGCSRAADWSARPVAMSS